MYSSTLESPDLSPVAIFYLRECYSVSIHPYSSSRDSLLPEIQFPSLLSNEMIPWIKAGQSWIFQEKTFILRGSIPKKNLLTLDVLTALGISLAI